MMGPFIFEPPFSYQPLIVSLFLFIPRTRAPNIKFCNHLLWPLPEDIPLTISLCYTFPHSLVVHDTTVPSCMGHRSSQDLKVVMLLNRQTPTSLEGLCLMQGSEFRPCWMTSSMAWGGWPQGESSYRAIRGYHKKKKNPYTSGNSNCSSGRKCRLWGAKWGRIKPMLSTRGCEKEKK